MRRALALLALLAPAAALAQSPEQFLPREPDTRPRPGSEVVAPERPEPAAPVAPPAEGAFILTRVVLVGATALGPAELEPLWADLLGQSVTVGTLDAVAAAVTAAYRARGYILSQAVVPEQTVTGGVVHLQVIEGFIDRVAIEGAAPVQQSFAERLFAPVGTDRPLRLGTLERAVLLSRDTFGGAVETVLEPSPDTFAAANLGVLVTPDPWRGFAAADNRGSRLYGPLTGSAGVSLFNLLGFNEQIDALAAGAIDGSLAYGQLRFEAPITPLLGTRLDGARLVLEADSSRADPDLAQSGSPEDLDIVQQETNLRGGLFVPFVRSRAQNLFGRLVLDWQRSESETDFAGDPETALDKLLVLEARMTWDVADSIGGVSLVDASLRQGLSVSGLTEIGDDGPAAGEPNFTRVALTLSRLQRLRSSDWSLYGEVIGQLASTTLPSSERFALGDATIGRGFAPGNTTGDSGYGGRLELRRYLGPATFGGAVEATELYVFGDYGAAYDRSLDRDGESWQRLGSVGFGARIDVTRWLTLTPEIARQTSGVATDTTDPDHETRAYLGVIARF